MPTRSDSLGIWLRHLEQLHPRGIDLGLDRVGAVYQRLGGVRPAPVCITVAGTNGKGSTVALLSAMLRNSGLRTGCYTSPHLLRYNERIRINAEEVSDLALVEAFSRIDEARGEISLSYFEFGTLAAFLLLAEADLAVAVLEVGLGGRLDAVNLVDADAAILTSVDLDHQEYLGDTREQIGWDKAHIFRRGRPAVIAAQDPPDSVLEVARDLGAEAYLLPEIEPGPTGHWRCPMPDGSFLSLPAPRLLAPQQRRNAAAATWAWWHLRARIPFLPEAAARAIAETELAGRMQSLPRAIETWIDVAHNAEAARGLAAWLSMQPEKPGVAVFAALSDKDLAAIVGPMAEAFNAWLVLDLRSMTPRAANPATQMAALRVLLPSHVELRWVASMPEALAAADQIATPAGRIVIFGSFITVAAALV